MAIAARTVRPSVAGRLVWSWRHVITLAHRFVRSAVGQRPRTGPVADVAHATLVAQWCTVRRLTLEQRLLSQFDVVEKELRSLVGMQVGNIADETSICALYNYANDFDLWDQDTAQGWVRALRFRGEILQNEHCRPTEAALVALYDQLQDMVWNLNERIRAWPDRGDELTVKDAEMAEQARLKIA